jgi:hypothetical protein
MFRSVATTLGVNGFPVRIAEKMPRLLRKFKWLFRPIDRCMEVLVFMRNCECKDDDVDANELHG